jgi:putative flippase GtrA
MKGLLQQFISFAGAGAIATSAHYLVLVGLVEGGVTSVLPASAAGAATGALVSYGINYRITFAADAPHRETLPKFLAVASVAFGINLAFMYLLVTRIGLPYFAAQMAVTAAILLVTFSANRVWTFAKK